MNNVKSLLFLFILSFALLACRATVAEGDVPSTISITLPTAVPPTPTIETATAVVPTNPAATATSEPGSNDTSDNNSNGSSPPLNEPVPAAPIISLPTDTTQVVALTGINMRSGPGLDFVVLDWLVEGQVVQVTGTSQDREWWEVSCGVATNGRCWITALPQYITPVNRPNTAGATRVHFAPGTFSTTLVDTLGDDDLHRYVLRALAGQKMLVQLNNLENDAFIFVQGVNDGIIYPDLSSDPRRVEIVLGQTQDYLIEVMSFGAATTYHLDVAVISTAVDLEPIRVAFNPGETSASFGGHVSPFLPIRYLVGAAANQTMHVALSPELAGANFSLVGASDGQPYKRLVNSDTFWSGTLPTTQDYILSVVVPPDHVGTIYHLSITIDPNPQLPDVPWITHDGLEPLPNICVAFNPGNWPVTVYDKPHSTGSVAALLGDWTEIVYSLLDWHQIRINGNELGWVQFNQVIIEGPCRAHDPVTSIVLIDSLSDLPEEICAAYKPIDAPTPPVAVRSQPNDDAPLLALLITSTAVEGYGVGDGYIQIRYGVDDLGWVRVDQVVLVGDCAP